MACVALHASLFVHGFTCIPSVSFGASQSGTSHANPRGSLGFTAASSNQRASSRVVLRNGESADDVPAAEESAEDGSGQEEKEEEEDPEIKALKDEIASMESKLRSKRSEASRIEDDADEYTKTGYYRKCAEMDNFRKRRDLAFQNSKYVSRASVMQKFLPVMDELNALGEQYGEDDFAAGYDALRRDFNNVMSNSLDLEEYSVKVGEKLNRFREAVVGNEYSEEVAKGNVLRQVSSGLEVKGNVVRFAECIVSKGSEADEKKKQEDEAASKSAKKSESSESE
jgi:molecular chaperone GrpE (heat shock protein)